MDRRKLVMTGFVSGSIALGGLVGAVVFDGKGDSLKSGITMTRAQYKERAFEPVY